MSLTSFLSFATSSPNNMGLVRNELQHVDLPTGERLTHTHTHTHTHYHLKLRLPTEDCINNEHSVRDVDRSFEASSLDFGRRHLVFLEPEVTIFGREDDAELVV